MRILIRRQMSSSRQIHLKISFKNQRLSVVRCVQKIDAFLGVQSSQHVSKNIEQNAPIDNAEALQLIVDDVYVMTKWKKSTSKSDDKLKRLHLDISNIYTLFSRSKLRSAHFGNRAKGKSSQIRFYIASNDVFPQQVKAIL